MSLREEIEKHYPRGWSFTPLGGADGKRPILIEWQRTPRETLEQALSWAEIGNVGLRTGANSGVIVVDIDRVIDPADVPEFLPPTVTVRTGRGKLHLYYRFDGKWGNRKIPLGPNTDIRGDGGQVVFVGSKNLETAGEYRWADGRSPDEIELAEFPLDALIEHGQHWIEDLTAQGKGVREVSEIVGVSVSSVRRAIEDAATHAAKPSDHPQSGTGARQTQGGAPYLNGNGAHTESAARASEMSDAYHPDTQKRGARHPQTLARASESADAYTPDSQNSGARQGEARRAPPHPVLTQNLNSNRERRQDSYAAKALADECDALETAGQGGRNHALNTAAFNLGQLVGGGVLDRHTVEASLKYACSQNGLIDDDGIASVSATLRSGLEAGIAKPRQIPERSSNTPHPRPPAPVVRPSVLEHVLVPGPHIDADGVMHEVGTHHFVDEAVERLPEDAIYRRDWVPGQIAGPAGKKKFTPLNPARTRIIIDSQMQLGRWAMVRDPDGERGAKMAVRIFVPCNKDLAVVIEEHCSTHPRVRSLRLIANHPIFRADWTVAEPGYRDGVYYDEPEDLRGLEPETDTEVIRTTFDDLLVDFPFQSEADRQNYIGLLLTPLVRPALGGNVPLHLILASKERTGKTKLAEQVLGVIIRGEPTPAGTLPHSEEEQEKRITSLLLAGEPILHLDNVREFLDSSVLASLLTASSYTGRMLGQSKTLVIPNNLTLVASGNNIGATGEIAKRTIPITLQPLTDTPEERTDFVHPNLPEYLRGVRRNVLACLLGMVRIWSDAGRPRHSRRLGGFEEWSEIVGGILQTSGYTEWRENEQQWRREADPRGEDLKLLVLSWSASIDSLRGLSAAELMQLAAQNQLFPEIFARGSEVGRQSAFGRMLKGAKNNPVAGHIIRVESFGSASRYRLEKSMVGGAA